MDKKSFQPKSLPFMLGYVAVVVGAIMLIFNIPANSICGKYVLAVGAGFVLVGRLLVLPKSDDKRVRRLNMQQVFSSLFLCLGAYMAFEGMRSWVLPLLVAALVDIYLSWAYGRYENKK